MSTTNPKPNIPEDEPDEFTVEVIKPLPEEESEIRNRINNQKQIMRQHYSFDPFRILRDGKPRVIENRLT